MIKRSEYTLLPHPRQLPLFIEYHDDDDEDDDEDNEDGSRKAMSTGGVTVTTAAVRGRAAARKCCNHMGSFALFFAGTLFTAVGTAWSMQGRDGAVAFILVGSMTLLPGVFGLYQAVLVECECDAGGGEEIGGDSSSGGDNGRNLVEYDEL